MSIDFWSAQIFLLLATTCWGGGGGQHYCYVVNNEKLTRFWLNWWWDETTRISLLLSIQICSELCLILLSNKADLLPVVSKGNVFDYVK